MFFHLKKNKTQNVQVSAQYMTAIPEEAKTLIFFTKINYTDDMRAKAEKQLSEQTGKNCIVLPVSFVGCVISM